MKKQIQKNSTPWLIIVILGLIGGIWLLNNRLDKKLEEKSSPQAATESTPCKAAFVDAGGPYYIPDMPFRTKLAPVEALGEKLHVSGKLLQSDCTRVVAGAVIDIWQADASGNYVNDWYRGKINTNEMGDYSFETVVPKGYGEGTNFRPPHIHFKIFIDNAEIITSQMFFPDVAGRAGFDDAYIMKVDTKEENGAIVHYGFHDIVLP